MKPDNACDGDGIALQHPISAAADGKSVAKRLSERGISPVFISYDEGNADHNYLRAKDLLGNVSRIHGVTGIHNAYQLAAKKTKSPFMLIIDADNYLLEGFVLSLCATVGTEAMVIWPSINAVNDLTYGNGAVKLCPTRVFAQAPPPEYDDFTTTMLRQSGLKFSHQNTIGAENRFNYSRYSAWRGGFREASKLYRAARDTGETAAYFRLLTWLQNGLSKPNGLHCLIGAYQGVLDTHFSEAMGFAGKANCFSYMREAFEKTVPQNAVDGRSLLMSLNKSLCANTGLSVVVTAD